MLSDEAQQWTTPLATKGGLWRDGQCCRTSTVVDETIEGSCWRPNLPGEWSCGKLFFPFYNYEAGFLSTFCSRKRTVFLTFFTKTNRRLLGFVRYTILLIITCRSQQTTSISWRSGTQTIKPAARRVSGQRSGSPSTDWYRLTTFEHMANYDQAHLQRLARPTRSLAWWVEVRRFRVRQYGESGTTKKCYIVQVWYVTDRYPMKLQGK